MKRLTRSISILSILTAFFMLPASGVAFAGTTAASTATRAHPSYSGTYKETPQASCELEANPRVPGEAFTVFFYLLGHNYSPPKNHKGNSVYNNSDHKLPDPPKGYRWFEYNVYPGSGTAQRIVTARNHKLTVNGYPYYTPNHYETFLPMFICKP
jgi:guanyl-specific ribonuclease Sa